MKMQKRQFRIGELATHLSVEKFVIRFWEKEFDMRTIRSNGGQRFYDERDVEKFTMIKHLLYDKGFTIAGAKQQLKERLAKHKQVPSVEQKILGSHKTTLNNEHVFDELKVELIDLKEKLIKLRELL